MVIVTLCAYVFNGFLIAEKTDFAEINREQYDFPEKISQCHVPNQTFL